MRLQTDLLDPAVPPHEPELRAGAIAGKDVCESVSKRRRGEVEAGATVDDAFHIGRKSFPLSSAGVLTKGQGRAVNVSGGTNSPLGASLVLLPAIKLDPIPPKTWRGLLVPSLFGAEVNNFGRLFACQRWTNVILISAVRPAFFQILHQVHNNLFKRFHAVLLNQPSNNSINRRELFGDVRTAFRELRIRGERYEAC